MPDFNRQNFRAIVKGLNLNMPVDDPRMVTGGYCPILTNVRSYQSGRIETRQGLTKASITTATASDLPVHSIRRLNSPLSGTFTRIVGGGTKLWYGTGASLTNPSGATGYSGYPLSFVPFEPDQAPEPWMYTADSSKMTKTNISGTTYSIGIAPPTSEPTASLAAPSPTELDSFTNVHLDGTAGTASPDGYTADDTILDNAGFSQLTRIDPTKVTVGSAVPDGTSATYAGAGWYTVYPIPGAPIDLQGISPDDCVLFSAETGVATPLPHIVQSAQASSSISTTIAAITYDSGTTGLCSIQVTTPVNLAVNSLVQVSNNVSGAAAEYTRIVSVTLDPDGTTASFRCLLSNTSGGHGHQAGDLVLGVFSFRVYCDGKPSGTIKRYALKCLFKAVPTGGIGYITKSSLTLNAGVAANRPILDDDTLHLSLLMTNAASLTEGKLMLNVDGDATDTTFIKNAYIWSFRASDFAQTVINQQTTTIAQQQALINATIAQAEANRNAATASALASGHYINQTPIISPIIRTPTGSTSSQAITSTGQAQWFELRFRVGDALRIGTDQTRTLQNVVGIRIQFNVTSSLSTDYIALDALWIGGTFGPDATDTTTPSYVYRTRGRDRTTGARSNGGPPMRLGGGISPRRQSVVVSIPSMTTAADASWSQVNTVDVYRYGGSLPDWHYLGSVANNPAVSATLAFTDNFPDTYVANQPLLEEDQDQPFPIIDKPRTGTCDVSGTTVTQTAGDLFSTLWAAGNVIQIAGVNYTLHNRPSTTTQLEIEQSASSQTDVTWTVYAPVLIGQPLPSLWGDLDGFLFGCGDPLNPGRLYWTNGNNPDAAAQNNYLDVTSPSEPLVHGCIFDGRAFVWSTDRMFAIYSTFTGTIIAGGEIIGSGGAPVPFRVLPIPNSQGLYGRWAFCVGPKIWFLGKDGIYETTGGEPSSITDTALFPWFPNEGNPGMTINGYAAPDLGYTHASTTAADFRLAWYDDQVRFTYRDTTGTLARVIYDTTTQAWWLDTPQRQISVEYGEEGTKDAYAVFKGASVHSLVAGGVDGLGNGAVFQVTGTDDDGVAIPCAIRFPSWDAGDGWADKQWGDAMADLNPAGVTVTVILGFNNYATTGTAVTTAAAARTQLVVPCLSTLARNVTLNLAWSGSGPLVYQWEPSFLPHSFFQTNWQTVEQTNNGIHGYQHLRDGYIAHTSTANLTLTVNIDGVDYVYTIANGGGSYLKSYVIFSAAKGKMYRYKVSSTTSFRLYNADCEVRVRGWGDPGPYINMKIPFEQGRI